jgi:hypothetical protein
MACGRALRDEESQRLRLGPVCRKRLERLLVPRPRRIRTQTAAPHPRAVPVRTAQLELTWDDDQDDEHTQRITDVPTGALL